MDRVKVKVRVATLRLFKKKWIRYVGNLRSRNIFYCHIETPTPYTLSLRRVTCVHVLQPCSRLSTLHRGNENKCVDNTHFKSNSPYIKQHSNTAHTTTHQRFNSAAHQHVI